MEQKSFTPRELADRWGFSLSTISQWRKNGKGPAWQKRGYRQVVYFLDDVLAFEAENPGLLG